ncbi:MAG: O-antigen ligase family protein [Chitinophagaceae bacterium]
MGNYPILLVTLLLIGLLLISDGRAGWLGSALSLVYIIYHTIPSNYRKRVVFASGVVSFIFLITLSVFYKPASSSGRMLIYKVSGRMLHDHWMTGLGAGQFWNKYNLYQSNYFWEKGIDSTEALLADNTFYAFNDILQLLIEHGILSFTLLTSSLCYFLFHSKKVKSKSYSFVACFGGALCIGIGSLFFYPFHVIPLLFIMVYCLAVMNSQLPYVIRFSATIGKVCKAAFICIGLLLTAHFYGETIYKMNSQYAAELAKAGFKNKALNKYRVLSTSYIKDGNSMLRYARELYTSYKIQQSFDLLQQVKKYYPTNEVYRLSATCAMELHLFKQAEEDYLTSTYMVPNRVTSRFELFQYYLSIQDTIHAIFWGNSVLNMKIKVPSEATNRLQKKTFIDLKALKSTS